MSRYIPKVQKNTLLFLAGLVWMIAGGNIIKIGTPGMVEHWRIPALCLLTAALIFAVFFRFVFYNMVNKHCRRIRSYELTRIPFYRFFDAKAYCIMAFMITFGILLRLSGWIPPLALGIFYTGLGSSLVGAGIFFLIRFSRQFAV